MKHPRLLALTVSGCLLATPALAADDWTFTLAPYVWMPALSGDVSTLPGAPVANIDLSFRDILENLDFAAFAAGEARRGDFFVRGEMSYTSVTSSAGTPGPLFSGARVTSKTFIGGLAPGYTFFRNPSTEIEAFAGFRYWWIDTDLTLRAGALPRQSVSDSKSFVDPIVGLSFGHQFTERWAIGTSASVGGFGVAADFEWGFTTALTYQAGENWAVAVGYRHLSVDYDKNGFVYDVDQTGPLVGLVFEF